MEAFLLPAELNKYAAADLPAPAKMMTAKGLAPLKPHEMITCVFAMTLDGDAAVAEAAQKTFVGFPENLLKTAVEGGLTAHVLDFLARHCKFDAILESVALHANAHDETLCFLAEKGSVRVIDLIANNQTRLMKCPALLDALGKNLLTGPAVIDRIFTFLQHQGIIAQETTGPEVTIDEFIAANQIELPQEFQIPEELLADLQDMPEEKAKTLYAKLLKMTITQKIKLALKGNKEARVLLVRDSNKIVSSAVMKSPKMTEEEVVAISNSKTVSDNVLRLVNQNKDWRRIYRVQLGLVTNPKTPFDIALRLLKMVRDHDLNGIAKSKSVSNAVATTARRMVEAKDKKH